MYTIKYGSSGIMSRIEKNFVVIIKLSIRKVLLEMNVLWRLRWIFDLRKIAIQ